MYASTFIAPITASRQRRNRMIDMKMWNGTGHIFRVVSDLVEKIRNYCRRGEAGAKAHSIQKPGTILERNLGSKSICINAQPVEEIHPIESPPLSAKNASVAFTATYEFHQHAGYAENGTIGQMHVQVHDNLRLFDLMVFWLR